MGQGGIACPKPELRKRVKGRKDRAETARIAIVRAACVARDGFCRIGRKVQPGDGFGACVGVSEWAHLWDKKRCFTRGMTPEERHDTAWTVQLCTRHHEDEERKRLVLRPLSAARANGELMVRCGELEALV
jgi:hypothetical protein